MRKHCRMSGSGPFAMPARIASAGLLLVAGLWVASMAAAAGYGDAQDTIGARLERDPRQAPAIEAFDLVSGAEGWVLSEGRLFWTGSGGGDWADITPAGLGTARIAAADFANTAHGWLAIVKEGAEDAPAYAIARTTDGGASWRTFDAPLFAPDDPAARPGAVYLDFVDGDTGWLVVKRATSRNFSLGALFATTDGGATWRQRSMPLGEPVSFTSATSGWTAGGAAGDKLFRTLDGGVTWMAPNLACPTLGAGERPQYQLPQFSGPFEGVMPVAVLGERPRVEVCTTHDGGATWAAGSSLPAGPSMAPGVPVPLSAREGQGWSIVVPGSGELSRLVGGAARTVGTAAAVPDGLLRLDMATADDGWAFRSAGSCSTLPDGRRSCLAETGLMRTMDGGGTWRDLALPPAAPAAPAAGGYRAPVEEGPAPGGDAATARAAAGELRQLYQGHGFDSCQLPTAAQLQTWMSNSPYRVWNLYIGGSALASCGKLTATFVAQLAKQGWMFIPTWVGPQSACWGGPTQTPRIDNDPAIATNQGIAEADAAIEVASGLGLTTATKSGAIMYYDLEAYNTRDTGCRAAAKAFISGWSGRLRARGNLAGVYGGTSASAVSDFVGIANVPDALWAAEWISPAQYRPDASVWNLRFLSNSLWTDHQRLHQYAGGHLETWGGVTINIDCDVMDGIVALSANGSPPPSAGFDATPQAGAAPLEVIFRNRSVGTYTSCAWDFGDGSRGDSCAEANTHVYANTGTYTVTLTLGGPAGPASLTRPGFIGVTPHGLHAIALCEDVDYAGNCRLFTQGFYPDLAASGWSDRAASAMFLGDFIGRYHVILFPEVDFQGSPLHLETNRPDLGDCCRDGGRSLQVNRIDSPAPPMLLAPTAGTVFTATAPVRLIWTGDSGGGFYAELASDASFTHVIYARGWDGAGSWTLPPLAHDGYYWRVKTRSSAGESGWAETWRFVVQSLPPAAYVPLVLEH